MLHQGTEDDATLTDGARAFADAARDAGNPGEFVETQHLRVDLLPISP